MIPSRLLLAISLLTLVSINSCVVQTTIHLNPSPSVLIPTGDQAYVERNVQGKALIEYKWIKRPDYSKTALVGQARKDLEANYPLEENEAYVNYSTEFLEVETGKINKVVLSKREVQICCVITADILRTGPSLRENKKPNTSDTNSPANQIVSDTETMNKATYVQATKDYLLGLKKEDQVRIQLDNEWYEATIDRIDYPQSNVIVVIYQNSKGKTKRVYLEPSDILQKN